MTIANITGNRVTLEINNNSVIPHSWGTGQLGAYNRDNSNFYTKETFMSFNTSVIPLGSIISSCTLDISMSGGTPPTGNVDSVVYENNRSDPSIWLPNAPVFNDFSQNKWSDDSSNKSILNSSFSGSFYTFPTSIDFIAMVDRWVQNTTDWNWGCVLSSDFGYFGYYRNIDIVTLNVDYTEPQLNKTDYYYRLCKKRKAY